MRDIFDILVPIALLAVATTLGFGIYSMFRGGEYGRKWSTKLMSLRVGLQAPDGPADHGQVLRVAPARRVGEVVEFHPAGGDDVVHCAGHAILLG